MKSNLLKFSAVIAFVVSGSIAACSDVHSSDVPNDDATVGGGSSGRPGHAGSTSSAGSSNEAGEASKPDAGAAGKSEAADAGAGGQLDSTENGGTAGSGIVTGGGG